MTPPSQVNMRPKRNLKRAKYAYSRSPTPKVEEESASASQAELESASDLSEAEPELPSEPEPEPEPEPESEPESNAKRRMQPGGQQYRAKRPRIENTTPPQGQMQFAPLGAFSLAMPGQPDLTPPQMSTPGFTSVNGQQLSSPATIIVQNEHQGLFAGQSRKLRVGGHLLESSGIVIPHNLSVQEYARRHSDLQHVINHRRDHVPALPESRVADLPPKPLVEPWLELPEDVTNEEYKRIQEKNNRISTKLQKIDRDRNNLAAKKSRQKRLEALDNTRTMLNDCFVELGWWKMKAISMGASRDDYDGVPQAIKENILKEVEKDIKIIDDVNEQKRKEEENKRRAARNQLRKKARQESTLEPESPEA